MYEHMVSVIGRVKTIQYIMTSLGQLRSVSEKVHGHLIQPCWCGGGVSAALEKGVRNLQLKKIKLIYECVFGK